MGSDANMYTEFQRDCSTHSEVDRWTDRQRTLDKNYRRARYNQIKLRT
jgi:hypothetical protein